MGRTKKTISGDPWINCSVSRCKQPKISRRYCARHNIIKFNVVVLPSPLHGSGLFSMIDSNTDKQKIQKIIGEPVPLGTEGDYVIDITSDRGGVYKHSIDQGNPMESTVNRYANQGGNMYFPVISTRDSDWGRVLHRQSPYRFYNAEMRFSRGNLWLEYKKRTTKGSELLINYGTDYWKDAKHSRPTKEHIAKWSKPLDKVIHVGGWAFTWNPKEWKYDMEYLTSRGLFDAHRRTPEDLLEEYESISMYAAQWKSNGDDTHAIDAAVRAVYTAYTNRLDEEDSGGPLVLTSRDKSPPPASGPLVLTSRDKSPPPPRYIGRPFTDYLRGVDSDVEEKGAVGREEKETVEIDGDMTDDASPDVFFGGDGGGGDGDSDGDDGGDGSEIGDDGFGPGQPVYSDREPDPPPPIPPVIPPVARHTRGYWSATKRPRNWTVDTAHGYLLTPPGFIPGGVAPPPIPPAVAAGPGPVVEPLVPPPVVPRHTRGSWQAVKRPKNWLVDAAHGYLLTPPGFIRGGAVPAVPVVPPVVPAAPVVPPPVVPAAPVVPPPVELTNQEIFELLYPRVMNSDEWTHHTEFTKTVRVLCKMVKHKCTDPVLPRTIEQVEKTWLVFMEMMEDMSSSSFMWANRNSDGKYNPDVEIIDMDHPDLGGDHNPFE